MGCSKKSGYLSDDIIGVGAGEASRLQIAPDLRLACRRLPVQEQLVFLEADHSAQTHLVTVQWKSP